MSWAKGMFEKPKRRTSRGSVAAHETNRSSVTRRKQDTLTELRWHLDLPTDSKSSYEASLHISRAVLAENKLGTVSKEEWEEGRENARKAESATKGLGSMKMQEVKTGLRLRYMVWGEDERVILLLHNLGDAAGVFTGLASNLASRSYKVIALDLRGHGDSSPSADRQYTPQAIAADVESFITEQDLYVRPIALVGIGVGAAVAASFAAQYPQLVGALVLAEFGFTGPADRWLYHPGQAAKFSSMEEATQFMCSGHWGHVGRRVPLVMKHQPFRCRHVDQGGTTLVEMKMDPYWFFDYSSAELERAVASATCHILVLHGEDSHMVSRCQAEAVAQSATSAKSADVYSIPKCGHYLLEDSPLKFRNAILGLLLKYDDALLVPNKAARTPEMLGIRALPQYPTIEEAIKALAPRKMPSDEVVEAELALLRADDEADSDDDQYANKRTGLIKEDPEYFGFVG
mmetsp:Transcript_40378/g.48957  ORF Transcript_40378/g.48957 Transcript_40378/m.48957 type:complete len:459 (+) Transcript_40378:183-1559(+)|eukprot:CAMPEP_0197844738 /NCGR_PEP_ID=MMETSP1438-20131217/1717_1 /TAXON_ID=1461541 /ORGANISM="Pterosperma sp., Strain CCMP1384" /LENGTH=458 /DNA_ID=CAMNT_0043455687 /DNA_START=175 /DNA_END=1551 /DNA_ORIENTATION=+